MYSLRMGKTPHIAKPLKARIISARQWDLDVVCQKQDWILLSLDESEYKCFPHIEELENQESGTLVIWNVFDNRLKRLSLILG